MVKSKQEGALHNTNIKSRLFPVGVGRNYRTPLIGKKSKMQSKWLLLTNYIMQQCLLQTSSRNWRINIVSACNRQDKLGLSHWQKIISERKFQESLIKKTRLHIKYTIYTYKLFIFRKKIPSNFFSLNVSISKKQKFQRSSQTLGSLLKLKIEAFAKNTS